jgi:hypothetical protein
MVERYRPRIAPPTPTPTPKAKRKAKRAVWLPLRLNRNLMNFPLARSARTLPDWRKDGAAWFCDLPGEKRIELNLARGAPAALRRCPTGFDMNVLFRLLAAVQQAQPSRIESVQFASVTAVLRELNLTTHSENRARLWEAFELWSHLTLHFDQWYEGGKRLVRDFPPPIEQIDFHGQRIIVALNRRWIQLAQSKKYYVPVPFPLPQEASAQNAALMVLTSDLNLLEEKLHGSYTRARRSFCQKIGLRCEDEKLHKIFALAREWFERRGGELLLMHGLKAGDIAFLYKLPRIPREKTGRSKGGKLAKPDGRRGAKPPKPDGRRGYIKKEKNLRKQERNDRRKAAAEDRFAASWRAEDFEPVVPDDGIPDPYAD